MQSRNPIPRYTRSATLVAAMVFSSVLAQAQQAAAGAAATPATTTTPETVVLEKFTVVAGFSGSLAAAAEAKKNSQAIVEVIMSEDIGKLPDVSIADSLTRLTGLTTQRTNGRSQGIAIRGLTGDFTTTLLNGREQVSSGLNRSVEFDNYPSELLNSVVVSKTADASLTGQGLAGTIDLQTLRPLSRTGRTVAVSGYYNWTEYGELTPGAGKSGERFNISYFDQFNDGKLGIAIGYAHSSTPWAGKQFQAWGYPTDAAGNYALGGTKSYVRTSTVDRDGLMGVIEWKPSSKLHSVIDLYTSKFSETQLLRGMEIPLAFWSSAQLQPGYTVSGGLITKAELRNVQPVVRNDNVTKDNDVLALGWNLKFGDGEGWTTVFDAGYSIIERNERNLETYSGLGFNQGATNPDTMIVNLTPAGLPFFGHQVDYSNSTLFRLTDPQGWGTGTLPATGMQGYLKYFDSKDELGQFKLLTRRSLDNKLLSGIELGMSYTDRFKRDGERPTGWIYNANGQSTAALPPIVGTTDFSFLGLGKVYAYDANAAFEGGAYKFFPNPNGDVIANRWSVSEQVLIPYVKADIDSTMFGVPMKGNVGVQYIDVEQSSEGISTSGDAGGMVQTMVSGGTSYSDFAPSLNLNFTVAEDTYVRLGIARQIARPRMFDMRASRRFNYNPGNASSTNPSQSPWSGDGGNPELEPWRSDSFDLALDKYFKNNMGYVSVAGFYKDLKNYIYEQGTLTDFTGYPYTGSVAPALYQGIVTQPVNGDGGKLQGLEFTLSLPSELFGDHIRGFGLVFNAAYTDSKIEPWGPGSGTSPIPNLSDKVTNVTLYYERAGFSARISQRYRSDYRAYITNFGAPNFKGDVNPGGGFAMAQSETVVDAQVGYTIQSGALKGLQFILQGYNLSDEPLITYNNGDPRQVVNYQQYGASYSFGMAYKF